MLIRFSEESAELNTMISDIFPTNPLLFVVPPSICRAPTMILFAEPGVEPVAFDPCDTPLIKNESMFPPTTVS